MSATKLMEVAGIMALLLFVPAQAADTRISAEVRPDSRQASDIQLLGSFDVIIADMGDRFDDWDNRDTRVYVEVFDGRNYYDHYFDNLPAMMFVLREQYGRAQISYLEVPEYAGSRSERYGFGGYGMIDGRYAWYVWDYGRYSRGGTPLVLAFYDYDDALREARARDADVLSYEEVMWRLNDWSDRSYNRVYWRGWDNDRWRDYDRWEYAWIQRWPDTRWDSRDGWQGVSLRLGDFTVRWESDRDVFGRDRYYYGDRYYYDDSDYYHRNVSDFGFDIQRDGMLRTTSESGVDEDSDRGHGNDSDGYDEGNPGRGKARGESRVKPGNDEDQPDNPGKDKSGKGKGKGKKSNPGSGKKGDKR